VRVAGGTADIETGQLVIIIFPFSGAFFHYFVMNKNEFLLSDGGLSLHSLT